jgi:hypothetical protein
MCFTKQRCLDGWCRKGLVIFRQGCHGINEYNEKNWQLLYYAVLVCVCLQ